MVFPSRPTQAGFTLIELIVAVVIVSILAAIAVPSYTRQIARGNRALAQRELSQLVGEREKFFLRRRSYPTATELLGSASGYAVDKLGKRTTVDASKVYTITMTTASGIDTLTATAMSVVTNGSRQAERDPDCQTFSLSSNGAKAATGTAGANTTSTCWRE